MRVLAVCAWIIGIVLVLFVILLLVAPTQVHIERSRDIKAPATVVWEHITRFERFNAWSTWRKIEPGAQFRLDGVDGTVGASTSWKGEKLGEGKLEHLSLQPYSEVRQRLSFYEPFEAVSDVYYLLKENNGVTQVTWAMDASYPRPQNILGMFMKGSLEEDFAQGLKNLQKAAETDAVRQAVSAKLEVKEEKRPAITYGTIRKVVPMDQITSFYAAHLPEIFKSAMEAGLSPGVATGLFYKWDEKDGTTDMAAAVRLNKSGTLSGEGIEVLTLPAGNVVYVDFYGPYNKTIDAHHLIDQYLGQQGKKSKWPVIEEYITDPGVEKDSSKWLTKVVYYTE